jgi:PAS domain S-box-containing protein
VTGFIDDARCEAYATRKRLVSRADVVFDDSRPREGRASAAVGGPQSRADIGAHGMCIVVGAMSPEPKRSFGKSLALLAAAVASSASRSRKRRAPLSPPVPKSFQTLFENATVGMMLVGPDGRFCRVNDCACEMTGYSREELLRLSPADLSPPEDEGRNRAEQEGVLRGEIEAYDNERRVRRKDGRDLWVHVSASLVDNANDPRGARAVLVAIDLTSRKEAEHERARALEVLELGDPCYVLDPQLRFSLVNSAFERLAGVARKDVVGRSIIEVLPTIADAGGRYWNELQRVLRERVPSGFEEHDARLDVWTDVRLYPTADGGVASVLRDVTSQRHAARERESLLAALEERDRRKDEFLAMLSHELRNPLAPIESALYVLEHGPPSGGAHAQTALAVIGRQVRHMTRMIDDLLDVTRISRGKIRLQRGIVDLAQLVRRAGDDYRGIFASAGVELAVQVPDAPLLIDGDATRIGQVMGNLLQNAVKFAPRGGHARLRAERDGDEVVVRMEDDGPGIPPSMLAHVFEPFVQDDRTLDRKKGGLGLGLALVKGLVEMHGGTATASRSAQGGAAFVVRLPLAAADHAPAPETALAHAEGRRVLVVEDNLDAAQTLKLALELDHHLVEVASAGPEGVEKARSFHPDVVLCDIGLPGLDGYGVARTLRSDPELSSAYLVALSGYAFEQDVQNAQRAGFDEHMSKPPDLEALAQIIARASPGRFGAPSAARAPSH